MKFIITILVSILSIHLYSQTNISGIVKDAANGERLIGAHIYQQGSPKVAYTDNNGYFVYPVQNNNPVFVSYIGYKTMQINYTAAQDTIVIISLETDNEIDEITIQAAPQQKTNVASLSSLEIKYIPSLGGKPDVMKALQLMPGIGTQNEGSSQLLVRGGDPGQNLYLFDNVSLIYVNHLGGFTSVFNPEIINKIDIYKGGFPSKYGGKLSSIVDITQREGNKQERKSSFSTGVTDASFAVEGPAFFKNSSFIITGRKTMVDPLMFLASKLSDGGEYSLFYGFHDINSKLSWHTNERNYFNINLYQGDDYLRYGSKSEYPNEKESSRLLNIWGNVLLSTQWKRLFSNRLHATNILSYNRYRTRLQQNYEMVSGIDKFSFETKNQSSVQDVSLRSLWKFHANHFWTIEYGLQTSFLYTTVNYSEQQGKILSGEKIPTLESAIYFENEINIGDLIDVKAECRAVSYLSEELNDYSIEPRVNLDFKLSKNSLLNFSYMKTKQYSHLIFTSGEIMSNEVWVPANQQIAPAKSHQYTAGFVTDFSKNMYQTEINAYYKQMENLATYKEGFSNLSGDMNWRTKIETGGKGLAYGMEFLLKKTRGKYTGFASYSYSKVNRTYPGINQGEIYDFEYDRPHSFALNINRKINKNLNFNATWVFQSGLPYTPVLGRHLSPVIEESESQYIAIADYYDVLIYGERNSERMKDYHRLDISLIYKKQTKKGRNAEWNFSVYNLYNRRNPYYYYYNHNESGEIYYAHEGESYKPVSLYQVSFMPIIPSVSYKVYFDKATKPEKRSFGEKVKKWLYFED